MESFIGLFSEHGLIGLIIGSMIFLIFTFIAVVERRDKSHNSMVKALLSEAKEERLVIGERFANSSDKLEEALRELTRELKDR